ncbi:universal stress protein UspA [Trinickia dabaoshanensis]|uniref:Universal stress protein UspA n=1 Tax=Trinickia dabaoshanensis TaxID=564714 RepID=A0A2N7VC43_9BURK|nr:universal stress protein [Trinickia dabaoshanensis]PMS14719.1 universal stress protein UspA [Trinickia dabaoshanensis]
MYTRILAPIDGSETSARAFDTALRLAREFNAQLLPLYVVDVPLVGADAPGYDPSIVRDALFEEGSRVNAQAVAKMEAEGVSGTPKVVETSALGDDIAHSILRVANEAGADLVVMGTHGRRGFRRLILGSVAERFLRIASRPVLLVPASDTTTETASA